MRAILVSTPGGPENLAVTTVPDLSIGPREIRIGVAAAGVNRADIAQRQGAYPAPEGAPEWPGLEVSGTVTEIGPAVTRFEVGDRVCALLAGGGYATEAVVHEELALPVPDSVDLVEAAALPETLATVWSNVFMSGAPIAGAGLESGETLLIHGGSSGIGTTAIQLAHLTGARIAVTAGTDEKLEACRTLGADILINYHEQDFVAELKEATGGRGADVILDMVGGGYAARNIAALAMNGRIMVIANQSNEKTSFNPFFLMQKRGHYSGTTLRSRPFTEKAAIIGSLRTEAWHWIESGRFRPVIDSRYSFEDAAAAHQHMELSAHIGKILLLP